MHASRHKKAGGLQHLQILLMYVTLSSRDDAFTQNVVCFIV